MLCCCVVCVVCVTCSCAECMRREWFFSTHTCLTTRVCNTHTHHTPANSHRSGYAANIGFSATTSLFVYSVSCMSRETFHNTTHTPTLTNTLCVLLWGTHTNTPHIHTHTHTHTHTQVWVRCFSAATWFFVHSISCIFLPEAFCCRSYLVSGNQPLLAFMSTREGICALSNMIRQKRLDAEKSQPIMLRHEAETFGRRGT